MSSGHSSHHKSSSNRPVKQSVDFCSHEVTRTLYCEAHHGNRVEQTIESRLYCLNGSSMKRAHSASKAVTLSASHSNMLLEVCASTIRLNTSC